MKKKNNEEIFLEKIKLQDCPCDCKKWKKSLEDYRLEMNNLFGNYNFSNFSNIKERLAIRLMSIDYLISLELWLRPFSVIGKSHKEIFIQQIASVYEVILEILLNHSLSLVKKDYKIIKNKTLDKKINTLGVLI